MLERAVARIRIPVAAAAMLCWHSVFAIAGNGTGLEEHGAVLPIIDCFRANAAWKLQYSRLLEAPLPPVAAVNLLLIEAKQLQKGERFRFRGKSSRSVCQRPDIEKPRQAPLK
jgi:hypothetical protein